MQALALLSTSLPYRDEADGDLRMMAYLAALNGCSRYGLKMATQAALRGEHGSRFFPSTAEMRWLYDAAMRPVHEQQKAEKRAASDRHEREVYQRSIDAPRMDVEAVAERIRTDQRYAERVLYGTPVGRSIERARADLDGRQIIADRVSLDEFKRGAANRQWGEGARYSPLLQTVFR